jgi:hypothetical protein
MVSKEVHLIGGIAPPKMVLPPPPAKKDGRRRLSMLQA